MTASRRHLPAASPAQDLRRRLADELQAGPAATTVVVLGSAWRERPWHEVAASEHPDAWNRPVLLVLPEPPEDGGGDLGTVLGPWLAGHVERRRNTVRFLAPVRGTPSLYASLARAGTTGGGAVGRAADDRPADAAPAACAHVAWRLIALRLWRPDRPGRSLFADLPLPTATRALATLVEARMRSQFFDAEAFATLVQEAAGPQRTIGDLLLDLLEPAAAPDLVIPHLGDQALIDEVARCIGRGQVAIRTGTTWRRWPAGVDGAISAATWLMRFRRNGGDLRACALGLPAARGPDAPAPSAARDRWPARLRRRLARWADRAEGPTPAVPPPAPQTLAWHRGAPPGDTPSPHAPGRSPAPSGEPAPSGVTAPSAAPASAGIRPVVVINLTADSRRRSIADEDLARLQRIADLRWHDPADDDAEALSRALRGATAMITGVGSRPLTDDQWRGPAAPLLVAHCGPEARMVVARPLLARGVRVSEAAPAAASAVAQFAVALIVLALRRTLASVVASRGDDEAPAAAGEPLDLDGALVALVGMSHAARRMPALLAPFGCSIAAYDPRWRAAPAGALGVRLVDDLDDLLGRADAISLHASPWTGRPGAAPLLDARRIARLRPGAVVVDTASRGPVGAASGGLVDRPALLARALVGECQYCTDVAPPGALPPGHPAWHSPHVLVTPRIAGASRQAQRRMGRFAVDEVARYLAGQALAGEVTADAW